jgi:1-deoxy-D-xylulose-5-phosphate synthase
MTATDLRQMMRIAQEVDGPIAIRYPRGKSVNRTDVSPVVLGQAVCLKHGSEVAVLSIGAIGNTVSEALNAMHINKRNFFAHYDMRWLKPIDQQILAEVCEHYHTIVTVEDGVINGGLGSAVAEYITNNQSPIANRPSPRLIRLGVNDQFVEHGSTQELYQLLKLDKEGICELLLQALEQ